MKKKHKKESKAEKNKGDGSYMKERELNGFIFLVYEFNCASSRSSCIGETCRHLKTRIEKHIKKDNKSHIFKHLHSNATCFDWYNPLSFKISDKAKCDVDLKIKEALSIN